MFFFLNVPWAYHGVSKYKGKTDRKYFYIDYDFKSKFQAQNQRIELKDLIKILIGNN